MGDLQEQLANLRRRIARIDQKFANPSPAPAPGPAPEAEEPPEFIEEPLAGEEIETGRGKHFESTRMWERHRRHGSMDVSDLAELPATLLDAISDGAIADSPPGRWAFLDTETTGLAGGSGTYAFLVGVGRITPEGFRLRQFFMRDYGEEPSLLQALSDHLAEFDVLVTYNGRSFDQPLLETRYRMQRLRPPFERMAHLDLLYGARRLWKLRFDSCRLVELENQILGVERVGDIPGDMIPYVYFEYLRTRRTHRLVPVFYHNALDILTLACLTAIVPHAFRDPETAPLTHGAEMVGLGRWLRRAEQPEQAMALFRRGIEKGLKDDLRFRTLWDVALMEKKLGREAESLATFRELAGSANAYQVPALEELAKHHEHRERNYQQALEATRAALGLADTPELRNRESRLQRRLGNRRLLP